MGRKLVLNKYKRWRQALLEAIPELPVRRKRTITKNEEKDNNKEG